jgi:hypothetical protein
MVMEEEFDVVTDVLQKHWNKLWDMSKNKVDWDIMDHIRMEQMDEIKKAIMMWKERKDDV